MQIGVNFLRYHVVDYVIIVSLVILDVVLNIFVHPFQRFVGKTMLDGLMFPLKKDTIPFWVVPIVAVGGPILIFFFIHLKQKKFQQLYQIVLGLVLTVALTAVLTDAVKNAIGRPRPDFFWRCFPNGNAVFDPTTGRLLCNGDSNTILEGHKSFPSGHTSWSFAGLGFLSIYLADKLKIWNPIGSAASLLLVSGPLVIATAIGITRLDDYVHHWQDVVVGALLGLAIGALCYHQVVKHKIGSQPILQTPVATDSTVL